MYQVVDRIADENTCGEVRPEQVIPIGHRAVAGSDVPSLVRIVEALADARERKQLGGARDSLFGRLHRQLRIPRQIAFGQNIMPDPGRIVIAKPIPPIVAMPSKLRLAFDRFKGAIIGAKTKVAPGDVNPFYFAAAVAVRAIYP